MTHFRRVRTRAFQAFFSSLLQLALFSCSLGLAASGKLLQRNARAVGGEGCDDE